MTALVDIYSQRQNINSTIIYGYDMTSNKIGAKHDPGIVLL